MKRVVFIVLAALLVCMSLVFAVSAAGTATPEVKVDDELGVLAAFFNFDGENFKTPTYAAYAVAIKSNCPATAVVGPSDDARYPSKCIDLYRAPLMPDNTVISTFGIVQDSSSSLPEWPAGKQTIKLKVMVKNAEDLPGGSPGDSTRPFYNYDGSNAYFDDAPIASSANSGANANRNTWRSYSRTTPENTQANWAFLYPTGGTYNVANIDDIEIWVYPSDGFILKSGETATDGNMITCADETYTFPTVFSLYPLSSATQWTDGTDVYDANDVVSAATLYGKSFYATGSGGGGTEPPAGDLTNYVASSNNTFEIEYTGLPGSYYALVILDGIAAPDAAPVVTESSVLFIDQKTANDQGVVTFSDVLLKEDGRPGSVYIGGGNLQKAVLLGYVNNNASGTNFVVSGNITSDSALPAKVKLVSETDSSKSFEVSTAAGSYEISVPEDVYTFTVTKKAHTSYTKTGFTVDADVVKNATIKGGDFGGDGVVNFDDFSGILMVYGTNSADYDINGDGVVNFDDFSTLLMNYNAASVTE